MANAKRHVVITGASRGLGRAVARAFCASGDNVSLFSRSDAEIRGLQRELGARAAGFAGDIRSQADITNALAHFSAAHGPIDVLVNNAGIGTYEPFLDGTADAHRATIEVNFLGLVLMTYAVAKEMTKRRRGHLIHIASDLGRRPLANMAVYAATKHAVVGFSQSLARELRTHGVKSSVLTPGIIDTNFNNGTEGAKGGQGCLTPESLANVVVYLANQPDDVVLDEVSIHALGQDF